MRTNLSLNKNLLGLSIGAMMACSTCLVVAQTETSLPSTVVRIAGSARGSIDGGKTWKMLKVGHIVRSGTLVQTSKTSDVDILLGEQVVPSATAAFYNPETRPANLVSLSPDTLLNLDKVVNKVSADPAQTAEEISLNLRQGEVTGNVKPVPSGSRYEISFAGGVAGVREATIYKLRATGPLTVLKGKVLLAETYSDTVKEVVAGEETTPETGTVRPAPLPAASPAPAPAPGTVQGTTPTRYPSDVATPPPAPTPAQRRPPPPIAPPSGGLRRAG